MVKIWGKNYLIFVMEKMINNVQVLILILYGNVKTCPNYSFLKWIY